MKHEYGENGDFDEPEHLRKIFIGGLNYKTTDESLRAHFEKWGELVDVVVMKMTKNKERSRGFGFITYSRASMVDEAQNNRPHKIDGRVVETKRAIPRQEIHRPEAGASVKKLFVGGLKDEHEAEHLQEYFKSFGEIQNVTLVTDKTTDKKRGFGFVEFEDYDTVDRIILAGNHTICGKKVDVKKAIAKPDANGRGRMEGGGGRMGGGGGRMGGGGGGWRGNGGNQNGGGDWNNGGGYGGGWNQQSPWEQGNQGGGYGGNQGGYGGNQGGGWGGQDNFGGGYQQGGGYGGGPMRQNFNQNRAAPYGGGQMGGGGGFGGGAGGFNQMGGGGGNRRF